MNAHEQIALLRFYLGTALREYPFELRALYSNAGAVELLAVYGHHKMRFSVRKETEDKDFVYGMARHISTSFYNTIFEERLSGEQNKN